VAPELKSVGRYAGCTRLLAPNLQFVKRQVWAHVGPMEHRGVHYTVRAGVEWSLWSVAICPGGVESPPKLTYGTRQYAERCARYMIDRWLQEKSGQHANQKI
jgi:hypothetical protein